MFSNFKNGVLFYPDLLFSLKLYDDLDRRYGAVAKNTIELPDLDLPDLYKGGATEDIPEDGTSIYDSFKHKISDEIQDIITKLNEAKKGQMS